MKHISADSSLRDVLNGGIFMCLASLDYKLFAKNCFYTLRIISSSINPRHTKYLHSMRLVMTILTICVSNFCDHWMVSYRELIFLRNTIFLLIFLILHFKDFNRIPFLLTIEISISYQQIRHYETR